MPEICPRAQGLLASKTVLETIESSERRLTDIEKEARALLEHAGLTDPLIDLPEKFERAAKAVLSTCNRCNDKGEIVHLSSNCALKPPN